MTAPRCYGIRMRLALAVVLLAGCPMTSPSGNGECETDRDCDGYVCARDHLCYSADDVREVRVTWTVRGLAASETTCGATQDLQISFVDDAPGAMPLGYAPVPCANGQFFVDKLPLTFRQVELGREGGFAESASISASGTASFDLAF